MSEFATTSPAQAIGGISEAPQVAFDEPWQAEAFATAVQLSRAGVFTWPEWVSAFSETIATQPQRDDESVGDAYYRQWMSTLENLLGSVLCLSGETVGARQALWHAAYLATPHGQPVALSNVKASAGNALSDTHERSHDHHHDHEHRHHHRHHGGTSNTVTGQDRPWKEGCCLAASQWQ
jgi:nitrile hydratase accessory protein